MKKWILKLTAVVTVILLMSLSLVGCGGSGSKSSETNGGSGEEGIKIGVLFSLSGTTAITEQAMHDAALLAVDEINAKGGVKGKKLIPVEEDYASDPAKAAEKAKKLIMEDEVIGIVGGYTSASRLAMLPVVEGNNSVLVYPTFYEGEEQSKNIIYTGSTPNQQLQDFVPWLIKNQGKKFFLIGSDYVYPVETNKQVKVLVEKSGGQVVGEEYLPLGHSEFSSVISKIKEAKPDVIFSDLVGDSVVAFYKQYKNFGLDPAKMPIASSVTDEMSVQAMGAENAAGHYASFGYFQTVKTPENKAFVEAYKKKYGENTTVTASAEAAYISVHVLAKSLEKASSFKADDIFEAFKGVEFQAPQGKIKIDETNHHTWLYSRIGKTGPDGQFEIVWESKENIHPEPWSKLIFPNGPPNK